MRKGKKHNHRLGGRVAKKKHRRHHLEPEDFERRARIRKFLEEYGTEKLSPFARRVFDV